MMAWSPKYKVNQHHEVCFYLRETREDHQEEYLHYVKWSFGIVPQLSGEQNATKVWSPGFHVKILLLQQATSCVFSGNLSAIDVISSKVCVGNVTGDVRLSILLPKEIS